MKKVIILGAGLVGRPMALDLSKDDRFTVTVADNSDEALHRVREKSPNILTVKKDLSNPANVTDLVSNYDFVINAMPGFLGFQTARAILEAGKNSVCISFYEEDPFQLDALAKANNVTMIMDCGIFPGMGSALIMHVAQKLDRVERVNVYVGGLPVIREWPTEYKAVFSPLDVIEEYTRPARYIENGQVVVRPALSDREYIFFPQVGTLEAFNTDGLRTLTRTLAAPNMKEKTLRYPGHAEKMEMLRALGFFSKEKRIQVNGTPISPLELTTQVLFPHWTLKPGEEDITVFKAIVEGTQDETWVRYTIDLFDRYDPETDVTSMARTTGYTATMALRMIHDGLYTRKGISPPEYMGQCPECVDYLLRGLRQRGVHWHITAERVDE